MSLTGTRGRAALRRGLLLLALCAAPGVAAGSVLAVDEAQEAAVEYAGTVTDLESGVRVTEGAVLRVAPGGRLRLQLSRHGFAELGGNGELRVERMPAASYAEDLRTVLRIDRGVLRLVWRHPLSAAAWPVFVYAGDQRLSLGSGEYFIEAGQGPEIGVVCVVSGEATAGQPGGVRSARLGGPACHRLQEGAPRQSWPRQAQDFIAARQQLNLAGLLAPASPPSPAPASVPAPAPQAASAPPAAAPGWRVNIVSSTSATGMQADLARLHAAGLAAAVVPVQIQGRTWHRLQVGGLGSADEARQLIERLQREFGYSGPWLQKAE